MPSPRSPARKPLQDLYQKFGDGSLESGDAQAVAALHICLAEVETKRGLFDSVRRHLKTGRVFLESEPNLWLSGFADIAGLCLAYLESDLEQASTLCEVALRASAQSGHSVTGMAAMTNLGHVLLCQGSFAEAERALRQARSICPPGGGAEVAILDGLAQIRLMVGDLNGCREALREIESTANSLERNSYYYLCTHLTRARLLLRSGEGKRARSVTKEASSAAFKRSFVNLTAHLRLLRAEALVRTGQHEEAAGVITEAVDAGEGPPSMEMLAEIARVAGLALAARPGPESGAVAFERAACILGTVGNRSGRVDLLQTYAEELWPRAAAPGAAFERQPRADTLPPPPRRVTARLDAVTTLAPAGGPARGNRRRPRRDDRRRRRLP